MILFLLHMSLLNVLIGFQVRVTFKIKSLVLILSNVVVGPLEIRVMFNVVGLNRLL